MNKRKITITLDDEMYERLKEQALREGFDKLSFFVRHQILKRLYGRSKDGNERTISVPVKNYRELLGYVIGKGFGSIASFATYSMELIMQRNGLTAGQKIKVEELYNQRHIFD